MKMSSVIVIGASAGGVSALLSIVRGLSPQIAAPVFIVLHIGARASLLPELLNAVGPDLAKHAEDGEAIHPGRIYIAPPDHHMTIGNGCVRLTRGPKENWSRPAIDPLFRSAAAVYGSAVIGVILTGSLNDGTVGLAEIQRRGGITVVQHPRDAQNPEMPTSAAAQIKVDYCPPLAGIPGLLQTLVAERHLAAEGSAAIAADTSNELGKGPVMDTNKALERPLTVTCPDCGGALRRSQTGSMIEYRCHIQHVYTPEVLAEAQFDEMEKLLRAAERSVNERAEICRQLAERANSAGAPHEEHLWRTASLQAVERAHELRDLVEQEWNRPENAAPS